MTVECKGCGNHARAASMILVASGRYLCMRCYWRQREGGGAARQASPLTAARLQECYDAVVRLTRRQGYPPTLVELGEELGIASKSSMQYQLERLRRAGGVSFDLYRDSRSIVVTPGWQAGVVVCYTTDPPRAWVRAVDPVAARRELLLHDPPLEYMESA